MYAAQLYPCIMAYMTTNHGTYTWADNPLVEHNELTSEFTRLGVKFTIDGVVLSNSVHP